jgi:hypothetical protein
LATAEQTLRKGDSIMIELKLATPDFRNQVVRQVYSEVPESVDDIIANPELAADFCAKVNSRVQIHEHFQVVDLNILLLKLRKRGAAKGGLDRKRRHYRGRNGKPSSD